jgi:lysophospholipase L1-like esterase
MLARTVRAVVLSASLMLSGSFAVPAVTSTPAAAAPTQSSKIWKIMPLGDSITRGGGQVPGQYVGYRAVLQANLKAGATGFRYNFVGSMSDKGAPDRNHEGHGGWTIDDLAAHIDGWMETHQPDIVLLHAGTNNITKKDSPSTTAGKLQSLIAQIRSHNADTKIFVAKIIKSRDPARRPDTNAYEALIPGVVANAGPNVYLVDQTSIAATDIYDWTHPNDFGYSKMAYNWYQSLRQVIGDGTWKAVASPYKAKKANVCQVYYGLGGRRVCSTRSING